MTPTCVISVALPDFPPLPNALRRMHWAARADEMRTWRGASHLTSLQALRTHPYPDDFPLRRAVLDVVVIRPDKHWPDRDNAIGAAKPVIDGMVSAGLLVGDGPQHVVGLSVLYETGPKGIRVDVKYGSAA